MTNFRLGEVRYGQKHAMVAGIGFATDIVGKIFIKSLKEKSASLTLKRESDL